ncbi:MAG: trypsin-like peptidase domain-containing protein [Candidatus Paceibacterota bacterium]|jgi:S1-C subfamily serine protease
MTLEKKYKITLISITLTVSLIVILNSVFMYKLFLKQDKEYKELSNTLENLQEEIQNNLTSLSTNLFETRGSLESLDLQIGSIDNEISLLKASVSSDFSGIVEEMIKSVVTIKTDVSQGSGFFIADNGYIITNAHVMENAKRALIVTYDKKNHNVYEIGKNIEMDLILLKINNTDYKPLELTNSDNVKQGQQVIAIGNPYGLTFSVTQGIVSNTHQIGENEINAYIQIDAALNFGNSGGPLINSEGKAIGINNFKISEAESLGFALESNYIKSTINEIYQNLYGVNLL